MGSFQKSSEHIERVVHVARVAKVVKGGKRFSFSALAVVGDGRGKVGTGLGKANEVQGAVQKATERAKKNMIAVSVVDGTIPHEVYGHFGAANVMLKPAAQGTGVIAGSVVRAVVEAAGVNNVFTKCIGTNNPHNVVKATMNGLQKLRLKEETLNLRSKNEAK